MNKETKNCPYCGEEILAIAKKCKHCGEWLDQQPAKEFISCPACGEQVEKGTVICPHCQEPLGNKDKETEIKQEKGSEKAVLASLLESEEVTEELASEEENSEEMNENKYGILNIIGIILVIAGFLEILLFIIFDIDLAGSIGVSVIIGNMDFAAMIAIFIGLGCFRLYKELNGIEDEDE